RGVPHHLALLARRVEVGLLGERSARECQTREKRQAEQRPPRAWDRVHSPPPIVRLATACARDALAVKPDPAQPLDQNLPISSGSSYPVRKETAPKRATRAQSARRTDANGTERTQADHS